MRLPRIFIAAGTRRGLLIVAALTVLCGLAMLPAIATMANYGASVTDFESAGSVARSQAILAHSQPWPCVSAVAVPVTLILGGSAAVFAGLGAIATRNQN